jgi:hypothetical protein
MLPQKEMGTDSTNIGLSQQSTRGPSLSQTQNA